MRRGESNRAGRGNRLIGERRWTFRYGAAELRFVKLRLGSESARAVTTCGGMQFCAVRVNVPTRRRSCLFLGIDPDREGKAMATNPTLVRDDATVASTDLAQAVAVHNDATHWQGHVDNFRHHA